MSRIDELQRLHEAATKGTWLRGSDFNHPQACGQDSCVHDSDGRELVNAMRLDNDAEAIVALHNSWPAIHRVLVAARMLMRCPRCIGPCDDPTVHAELGEALRALDGGA